MSFEFRKKLVRTNPYLIGTWTVWVTVILIYDDWIWYIFHQHVLEDNISGRSTAPLMDKGNRSSYQLKIFCGWHNEAKQTHFTCHVLILAPFLVFDKTAPSTLTLRTCAEVFRFPKLPILINKKRLIHQLLWSNQSNPIS